MSLPVAVLTAWRTVQQLPSLDDHPVLRQPREPIYILTLHLRRVHDVLRVLVDGIERGDPADYSALAADVLEELELHQMPDEDVASVYMLREEVREAVVTRTEAYTDLARAIARSAGGESRVDTPLPPAKPRRRTPPSLREAMFDWDPMDMVLMPEDYESDDIHALSKGLFHVCSTIIETLGAYQRGDAIAPSTGPDLLERLDRCDQLMKCDDVAAVGANDLRKINRFIMGARRIGEEYARMGRHPDAAGDIDSPDGIGRRPRERLPLPDAVREAWQLLQQRPPFDEHPVLRDPRTHPYLVTERVRGIRDTLSVLIAGLEQSEALDYPTRAADVLEQLHVHDTFFAKGVEHDHGSIHRYTLPTEPRAAVMAEASALGDVARAIAKVEGTPEPVTPSLIRGGETKFIPQNVLTAMRGWDHTDARIVHADDYTANGTHDLEHLLSRVITLVMNTAGETRERGPVKPSVGAELFRLLDECDVILGDAEVARVVAKQRRRLDKFLSTSRTAAQEFTRLGGGGSKPMSDGLV